MAEMLVGRHGRSNDGVKTHSGRGHTCLWWDLALVERKQWQVEQSGCWMVTEAAPQIRTFRVSPEGTGFWDDCGTGGLLHSTLPNLQCPHNSKDTSLLQKHNS